MESTRKTPGRRLADFLLVVAFANLVFFGLECAIEGGGSTPFGFVRDGHYFLYQRGYRTEVSARTFRINQLHGYSMYLTIPLLVLGLALRRLSEVAVD